MALCIEKLPHSCGSSDGLQVFQDGNNFTGYCFSCYEYVPRPYGDDDGKVRKARAKISKSPEEIKRELAEIGELTSKALPDRSLRKESVEYFGIKVGVSEQDGTTPVFHFYPYLLDGRFKLYRARFVPSKSIWQIGDTKAKRDLFGWDAAISTGAKRLYITEGELDTVALFQALKDKQAGTKWADYNPAVVSLTNGSSGAKKDITNNLSKIRSAFKEIVLVFDNDDAGKKAEEEVLQIIPTAVVATYPGDDPNDAVIKGRSKALADAVLFKTQKPKNTRIVNSADLYEEARTPTKYGLSYPWKGLTKLTRGMRFGETSYLGAGVKMGKSEFRNTLVSHLIIEHGLKVFLASPEEALKKTRQMVLGKAVGEKFHDPEVEFNYDAYDIAHDRIARNLYLLDLYQHLGWDSLRADIIDAAEQGCRAVFIDPITNLTNGVASGEANTALQGIAQDLAAIALDFQLIVWIFCHLKAPDSGDSHERGGRVLSHQFAGSRAMMRSCHTMMGLEGNKDPAIDEDMRNRRQLVILEDREFGASGSVTLWWNKETGLFSEVNV